MSSAVTAEPDSTSSTATDAVASKQKEETNAATSDQTSEKAAETEEGEQTKEKTTEESLGGQEAEAEAKEAPQDNGPAPEPEQPAQVDSSDKDSAEAAPAESEKASPLQEKIIRQVEFYFGDRNFPKDKFLQQTVESSKDGWVPLTTLLTFNRLKALSSDAVFIASALRKATNGIIEVSDDGKSVRRHPDKEVPDIFDPEFRKEMISRTIYAKGFPEDTKLDQIQEFMDRHGKVHLIHMRRLKDRTFKGSIFVEFVTVEDAEKFVKSEKIQFNGNDLLVEWKSDYFKRKEEERKQKKEEQKKSSGGEDKEEEKEKSVVKVSGCILHFTGVESGKSRDDLKGDLQAFGTIAFVDFPPGKTEGYVRFREEDGAKRAREGLLGKAVGGAGVAQLCGCDVELKVLEGEEEEQYWHKVLDGSGGREKSGGGGRRGGRGRGRGRGGGYNRKRKERLSVSETDSQPPESKSQKTVED